MSLSSVLGNFLLIVLQVFLGAVLGFAIAMRVEFSRKPKLKLSIDNPHDGKYPGGLPCRTLRVIVENENPKLQWVSRNPASRCYGFITFYHLDGQDIFGRSMPIKWSNLPARRSFPDGRIETYPFEFVKYIDIHAGYSERLDLAARYENDSKCYGWCYDNYFSDPLWRNRDRELDSERFLVKVEVICAGGRSTGLYRLINDVPVNAFRLENAQSGDYKKIL